MELHALAAPLAISGSLATLYDAMTVSLYRIRVGDRARVAPGWLILSEGAVRGMLTSGEDGEILFGLHFDRRIRPVSDLMVFRDLAEAQAWLEKRLAG